MAQPHTMPLRSDRLPMLKTIGMVAVADLAAIAEMPFSAKRYAIANRCLGMTISPTLLLRADEVRRAGLFTSCAVFSIVLGYHNRLGE
jgi:hypothetical protein